MKSSIRAGLFALAIVATELLGVQSASYATTVGFPAFTGSYAYFDTFTDDNAAPGSGITFLNATTPISNTSRISASLTSATPAPASIFSANGDNGIYSNVAAFNFTLNGQATSSVDSITLMLKLSSPATPNIPNTSFFTTMNLTLNNGSEDPADPSAVDPGYVFSETANGIGLGIISYTWSGLDLTAGETFSISMASIVNNHVFVDGVLVSAVPEPSTIVFAGLGLVGLAIGVRRRRAAQSK